MAGLAVAGESVPVARPVIDELEIGELVDGELVDGGW